MSLKDGEEYKIICVDDKNWVLDGAKTAKQVLGYNWHGGDNQTWILKNKSGNLWTITNKALGNDGALDASKAEANLTILFAFHGQENQQWALEPLYPGSYVHFIRSIHFNSYLQLNGYSNQAVVFMQGPRITLVPKDYNNKKTQFVFAEMQLDKPVPVKEPEPEPTIKPEGPHEINFGNDEVLDGSGEEVKIAKKRDAAEQVWHFNESKLGYKITIHYPTHGSSKVLCEENGKLILKESEATESQTWKFVPTGTGSFDHYLVHSGTGKVIQNNGIGNPLSVAPKDPSNPKQKCSFTKHTTTTITVVEQVPTKSSYTIVYKHE